MKSEKSHDKISGDVRGDSTKMGKSKKSTEPGYDYKKSMPETKKSALEHGFVGGGRFDAGSDGMKPD